MSDSNHDIAEVDDAINRDDVDQVEELLSRGIDPNSRDVAGDPLLISAAWIGSPRMVKLLLGAGADPLARDRAGKTALERLAQNTEYWDAGHDEVKTILETAVRLRGK